MRVAILGPGAIGLSLGALLARAGEDVTLIARGEHARALRDNGARVTGTRGAFTQPVRVVEQLAEAPDLLVACTKTQDLRAGLEAIAPALSNAVVVTTQNGLAADVIAAEVAGAANVVGCVTVYEANLEAPAHVDVGRVGGLLLGAPTPATPARAVERAAAALANAVPARAIPNLAGARWMKLLVNLNNALPAATGLSVQEITREPRLMRAWVRSVREGLAVARAECVRLAPIPWASPLLVRALATLPEGVAVRALSGKARRVIGDDNPLYGSTLQSLKRGRATEIDYLNGEIIARARPHGIEAPVNAALVEAVHEVEKRGAFIAADALAARAGV